MPYRPRGRTTLRDRVAARVSFSALLRALSDYALSAVPATADEYGEPTDPLVVARWAKAHTMELTFRAVCLALKNGATWHDVAVKLNFRDANRQPDEQAARDAFGWYYEAWERGEAQVWTPPGAIPVCADADDNPVQVAGSLDQWYEVRTGDGNVVHGARVVSDPLGLDPR